MLITSFIISIHYHSKFYNPLDSQTTKLLKTIFLSTTNSFHQIISKKAKITILFLLKTPKNNKIILVFSVSISPMQSIEHTGIPRFMLLLWGHTKKNAEAKTA